MPKPMILAVAALIAAGSLADVAAAKSARCYTTDDGEYDCEFTSTDSLGSFEISAPGKPTMILVIDSPGVAFGFADYGTGRNVALPGRFIRSDSDRACWANSDTGTEICAW